MELMLIRSIIYYLLFNIFYFTFLQPTKVKIGNSSSKNASQFFCQFGLTIPLSQTLTLLKQNQLSKAILGILQLKSTFRLLPNSTL